MARLAGVDLPNNKHINIALTYIHGIGRSAANRLLKSVNINADLKTSDLTGAQIQALASKLETTAVEGDLRKIVRENIQRLKRIGSYRGLRHHMGLPVRGQHTRTNARTRKGKRKTVGAMTKEMRTKLETPAAAAPLSGATPAKK